MATSLYKPPRGLWVLSRFGLKTTLDIIGQDRKRALENYTFLVRNRVRIWRTEPHTPPNI